MSGDLLTEKFSQSVVIGGLSIRTRDLSIRESASDRIPVMSFVVEEDAQVAGGYDAVVKGATVTVTQTVGLHVITNLGTVSRITHGRNRNSNFKSVSVVGEEHLATRIRFLDSWVSQTASDIVQDACGKYAPSFPTNIASNSTVIEEITSSFESLYDLMERVCQLTGWAWKIQSGTIHFFDPNGAVGPAISQPLGIMANTLSVSESIDGLVNISYMPGYLDTTVGATKSVSAGDCLQEFSSRRAQTMLGEGWEFDSEIKISITGDHEILGLGEDEELNASFNNGMFRLSHQIYANSNTTVHLVVRARKLIWTSRRKEESIAVYGERPGAPLPQDGGSSVARAIQVQDNYLDLHAWPVREISMETSIFGHRHDSVVNVELVSPAMSVTMYVAEVNRTTRRNELSVSLKLVSPEE